MMMSWDSARTLSPYGKCQFLAVPSHISDASELAIAKINIYLHNSATVQGYSSDAYI